MQKLKDWLVKYNNVDPHRQEIGLNTLEPGERGEFLTFQVFNAIRPDEHDRIKDIALGCRCNQNIDYLIETGLVEMNPDGTYYLPDFAEKAILPWAKFFGMSHPCASKKQD